MSCFEILGSSFLFILTSELLKNAQHLHVCFIHTSFFHYYFDTFMLNLFTLNHFDLTIKHHFYYGCILTSLFTLLGEKQEESFYFSVVLSSPRGVYRET